MFKLKLKSTPADEAERRYRRARRQPHKLNHYVNQVRGSAHDRGDETSISPNPSGVLGAEERLDTVEAQMNDYAQVPKRWRSNRGPHASSIGGTNSAGVHMDPRIMDDIEYAEWLRKSTWRKLRRKEHAASPDHQASAKAARRRERAINAEIHRLEAAASAKKAKKKQEREAQRLEEARTLYDLRWRELLSGTGASDIGFSDIPWPILAANASQSKEVADEVVSPCTITSDTIASFLLSPLSTNHEKRKPVLRDALLRFHPDKFEGRVMYRVREKEQAKVREAVCTVARLVGDLLGQSGA